MADLTDWINQLLEPCKLAFTKLWTSPDDFPTYEADETQVRADLQQLHNETRDHINEVLIPLYGEVYEELLGMNDRVYVLENSKKNPTVIVPEQVSPDVSMLSHTIKASDLGAMILCTGDAEMPTLLTFSMYEAYAPGMEIEIVRFGAGAVSLGADSHAQVYYRGCTKANDASVFSLPAQYASRRLKCLTCEKIGTGEYQSTWLMTGDIS